MKNGREGKHEVLLAECSASRYGLCTFIVEIYNHTSPIAKDTEQLKMN